MEFKILQKPSGKNHLYIIDDVKAVKNIASLSDKEQK